MIREFDSQDNGLTVDGFLQVWTWCVIVETVCLKLFSSCQAQLYMCRSCGLDESLLRNDLKFMVQNMQLVFI
jgi:hypothetical protein